MVKGIYGKVDVIRVKCELRLCTQCKRRSFVNHFLPELSLYTLVAGGLPVLFSGLDEMFVVVFEQ